MKGRREPNQKTDDFSPKAATARRFLRAVQDGRPNPSLDIGTRIAKVERLLYAGFDVCGGVLEAGYLAVVLFGDLDA